MQTKLLLRAQESSDSPRYIDNGDRGSRAVRAQELCDRQAKDSTKRGLEESHLP